MTLLKKKKTSTEKFPILIVTENLEVGGAEKYTVTVANELYRRGHRVIVLANEGPFRKHLLPGIRFVRAFFEHGVWGVLYGAFQMIRVTIEEKIPLIHAQKLESSQAAWLARFVTGVPVVKTAHGYTPKELERLGTVINKYSNRVVTVVDWLVAELWKNGVQEHKLDVIYNGTEPFDAALTDGQCLEFRKELGIHETDKVIVSMARLEKGKNYLSLIKWFRSVLQSLPNTKLIIVGKGPEEENLKNKTKEWGLDKTVIFVDATTDVRKYLQIADLFCTPSVARGMSVLEAMAAGLPVVGVKPLGNPQVVLDGENGYTVEKGDGEKFVQRTIELLSDPKLAKAFGLAGEKMAREIYSGKSMVDQLVKIYEKTIK